MRQTRHSVSAERMGVEQMLSVWTNDRTCEVVVEVHLPGRSTPQAVTFSARDAIAFGRYVTAVGMEAEQFERELGGHVEGTLQITAIGVAE